MSTITDTATVTLNINGTQAKKVIDDLKTQIDQTKQKIRDMQDAGADPKAIEKVKRQLRTLQRQLADAQTATQGVADVMANLDRATPRQLEKTLRALNKQFKDAEQGSEAYNELAEKIRLVKEALAGVREQLEETQSPWEQFCDWAFNTLPAIVLVKEGYEAVVQEMRQYVDAYAEMDQEMANVSKYTGMSSAEVNRLNDEFRKLDTRSSREQLNILAQEAGRLGKTSVEDVLGFVRAADKINVALDDLGKGATLTLSKLTGTFRVEETYGTEQSLMKVGSVINELSQNCSASAPYIANFTERMAGVGVQANMTIPQIMGLAAVLDVNSQAVEASATAVSQVLVRLYQDPAKYARVAGLEIESFTKLLREDANAAFNLFLETLGKAGGLDVLSPMFKDMGETGSRAIAALSTLAQNIGFVKEQQEAAAEAFAEGTSIQAEFDVQNNTVAASLDKCKNAANELRVELGGHLYPLVGHFLTTSSAVMRGLLVAVRFISEHRTAIISLTAAIAAYTAAVQISTRWEKISNALKTVGNAISAVWTARVHLQSAAVALFSGNLGKATVSLKAFSAAIKASPVGLLISLITGAVAVLTQYIYKSREYTREMDDAAKSATSFAEEIRKETSQINRLFGALEGAKKGTKEYNEAKQQIISQYGTYLSGLISETGEITNLALAYDRLTSAAEKSARARAIASAREKLDSTYFSGVDDLTEKLRAGLSEMDVDERTVTRIVTSVSQAMAKNAPVPAEIRDEIARLEYKKMGMWQSIKTIGGGSPLDILDTLDDRREDYTRRSGKLDRMDVNHFAGMDQSELDTHIQELTKSLGSNLPVDSIDVTFSVSGQEMADEIAREIAGSDSRIIRHSTLPGVSIPANPERAANKVSASPGTASPSLLPGTASPSLLPASGPERAANKVSASHATLPGTDNGKQKTDNPQILSASPAAAQSRITQKIFTASDGKASASLSRSEAENLLRELLYEKNRRGVTPENQTTTPGGQQPSGSDSGSADTPDRFEQEKQWRRQLEAEARISYAKGESSYSEHLETMAGIQAQYNQMLLDRTDLSEQERLKIQADYWESVNALIAAEGKTSEEEENRRYESQTEKLRAAHLAELQDETLSAAQLTQARATYQEATELAELEHLRRLVEIYEDGSDKKLQAQKKYLDAQLAARERHRKEIEEREKQLAKVKEEWFGPNAAENKEMYDTQLAALQTVYEMELQAAEGNAQEKLRIEKAFLDALAALRKKYGQQTEEENVSDYQKAIGKAAEWLKSDGGKALTGSLGTVISGMSSIFSGLSTMIQAELSVQTAAIESRYDKEIERAEGNSYKVARLEEQKQEEIAKLKNEANKKMFAMEVIQAVAQTATNALNAFGSAAAIPVVGHIMAPIAAAMAVAAGMIQVANIKKQQQAAQAQGYSKGGFTKPGAVDEPAGIVHAGEWVASQKLLASPVARPLIEALDYAQRTDTIGSLRAEDVSGDITAARSLSMVAGSSGSAELMTSAVAASSGAIRRLIARLDEPFVTVNTVTGDTGSKQAEDKYKALIRNKTPRSRR